MKAKVEKIVVRHFLNGDESGQIYKAEFDSWAEAEAWIKEMGRSIEELCTRQEFVKVGGYNA